MVILCSGGDTVVLFIFWLVLSVIGLGIGALLVALAGRITGRTFSLPARLVSVAAAAAVIALCTGRLYFSGLYHAGERAELFLESSDTVKVTENAGFWFFDGPGEETAVIFYPGAMVDAESYAPLMFSIAAYGEDCFLVKMPLDIALLDTDAAKDLTDDHDYSSWYLAGHSLGGVCAARYAASAADEIDGVILMASFPVDTLADSQRLLTIRGSEDKVLNAGQYENSRSSFPPDTAEIVIDGGNHAGFGDYGEQKGDGEALITPEEQQTRTASAVVEFIEDN